LFILENFDVSEVWTNGEVSDTPSYLTFRLITEKRGIPLRVLSDRTPAMAVSDVAIRILNPSEKSTIPDAFRFSLPPEENEGEPLGTVRAAPPLEKRGARFSDEINDRSLVMKLTFGRRSFLLPGDISKTAELRIVESTDGLDSDVLFVPHHGGFRSSTVPFLEKVRPQVAVVSCGADNVFRDPHPDVLRRLGQVQSRIYRTDRDGAVTIETDGNELSIRTFRQGNP
jgi:competence protein ComEC